MSAADFIAAGHNHLHFLRPFRPKFKDALVYLHRYWAGICHNHSLATADVLTVVGCALNVYRTVIYKYV